MRAYICLCMSMLCIYCTREREKIHLRAQDEVVHAVYGGLDVLLLAHFCAPRRVHLLLADCVGVTPDLGHGIMKSDLSNRPGATLWKLPRIYFATHRRRHTTSSGVPESISLRCQVAIYIHVNKDTGSVVRLTDSVSKEARSASETTSSLVSE